LENAKEIVVEFKRRLSIEIMKQGKLEMTEERDSEEESYWRSIQQRYCIDIKDSRTMTLYSIFTIY